MPRTHTQMPKMHLCNDLDYFLDAANACHYAEKASIICWKLIGLWRVGTTNRQETSVFTYITQSEMSWKWFSIRPNSFQGLTPHQLMFSTLTALYGFLFPLAPRLWRHQFLDDLGGTYSEQSSEGWSREGFEWNSGWSVWSLELWKLKWKRFGRTALGQG